MNMKFKPQLSYVELSECCTLQGPGGYTAIIRGLWGVILKDHVGTNVSL